MSSVHSISGGAQVVACGNEHTCSYDSPLLRIAKLCLKRQHPRYRNYPSIESVQCALAVCVHHERRVS